MFVAINGASTLVSPFHIIIHALFKSLSFLLSGSPIHVQPNFQSIYKPRAKRSCIPLIMFILAGSVLIVPLSKEAIIHSSNCILSPAFVTMIAVLGGIFTMIYTLKIYLTQFTAYSFTSFVLISSNFIIDIPFSLAGRVSINQTQLSFISPRLTITSIFIDQSLEYFLSISRSLISSDFLLSIDFPSNGILFSLFLVFLFSKTH